MEKLLNEFEQKKAEIVFEWQDTETSAKGWIVINSLRGGAAAGGGGTGGGAGANGAAGKPGTYIHIPV